MPPQTYLMRVWLPDRPGVLGAVATRLGAVKGDLLGIEIIERGGGMVIDELLISLPSNGVTDLMMREVTSVEGVRIEDLQLVERMNDSSIDPLTACAAIAEWPLSHPAGAKSLAERICHEMTSALRCSWVALVDQSGEKSQLLASVGRAPDSMWVEAYAAGARHARQTIDLNPPGEDPTGEVETDTFCVHLARSRQTIVLGREELSFRQRDRHKAEEIGRVADAVCALHPSIPPDWCAEKAATDPLAPPIQQEGAIRS